MCESIAAGIADRERSDSGNLLANINPTFNWVRLAQRVPVRVKLDDVPANVQLVVGRTATVVVEPGTAAQGLNSNAGLTTRGARTNQRKIRCSPPPALQGGGGTPLALLSASRASRSASG